MECMFNENDKDMFHFYLNKCKYYFEYGSGGSTYNSVINNNIEHVYSVESDSEWYNNINIKLEKYKNKFKYFYIDINSSPNTFGRPGNTEAAGFQGNCTLPKNIEIKNSWIKYSDVFQDLDKEIKDKINIILIDGRFRAACCLKLFEHINYETIILFDDFKNRSWFHIVLDYFKIINENKNGNMVALQKKDTNKPSNDIIKKYEIDYR